MEEQELMHVDNLTMDGVLENLKDFPLEPTRAKLIITVNTTEEETEDLKLSSQTMAETQFVMAVGPHVQKIVPGDRVLLNLERLLVKSQDPMNAYEQVSHIKIRPMKVNGRIYALIDDGVIDCIDRR